MCTFYTERRFPLDKRCWVTCCLILLNCTTATGQLPIRGEVLQTVEDVYLPKVEGIEVETLSIPWSLVFLPNRDALVAEQPGSIRRITQGTSEPTLYAKIDVIHEGNGGLMGMALHPAFEPEPFTSCTSTVRKINCTPGSSA